MSNISPTCNHLPPRGQQYFSIQQLLQPNVHLSQTLWILFPETATRNCHAVENSQHWTGLNLLTGFKQSVWRGRRKAICVDRAHLLPGAYVWTWSHGLCTRQPGGVSPWAYSKSQLKCLPPHGDEREDQTAPRAKPLPGWSFYI